MKSLPQTGTAELLEILSPFLDNGFVNDLFTRKQTQGRHAIFSPAQLFRVLLLALLTPAHSFNLLVRLLGENRLWREFAFLPNKHTLPDAKMLHQFRARLDLIKLRAINAQLLHPLLASFNPERKPVAIIDSTDLPAGKNPFKKKTLAAIGLTGRRPVCGPAKATKAVGLSATKSTACVFGFPTWLNKWCWCRS